MKNRIVSFVRSALHDELGQTLPLVVLAMTALLGVSGIAVDLGRAYVIRGQIQNSANASALAAAGYVYTSQSQSVNSTTVANQYGPGSGDENANSALGTVTTTVTTKCLNLLLPKGSTCSTSSPPNAIKVVNSVQVSTFFMGLFGVKTLTVNAAATASMQGMAQPWNVAIIVDATGSMSTADSNCGNLSEFMCALSGIQTLLSTTNPGNGKFHVSLFSFPNLSTANFSETSTCGSTFASKPYTFPLPSGTSYTPLQYATSWTGGVPSNGATKWTATYQITSWDNGYYLPTSTTTEGLNTSDNLVKVIGYNASPATGSNGTKGCLTNPGGQTTSYAGVIYAAQSALLSEQAAYPGSKNAMILLSDGQANVTTMSNFASGQSPAVTTPATAGYSTLTGTGLYPDSKDQCQQAIMAAQYATNAGTTVYAVAYGSGQSGCGIGGTDTTLVATGKNAAFTLATLTPCVVMENIASSLNTFYSDYNKSGSGSTCQDASHTVVSLQDIFLAIGSNFTKPRLLPNNAT